MMSTMEGNKALPSKKGPTMAISHTLTLSLNPALVPSVKGAPDTLTIQYWSARKGADATDGNARAKASKALCASLALCEGGRTILASVEAGDRNALQILYGAIPALWKRPAAAYEAATGWRNGSIDPGTGKPYARPDAHPDYEADSAAALRTWSKAQEKLRVVVVAEGVTPSAPYGRPTLTLDALRAHQTQEGATVQGRTSAPAWKGRKVA